MTRKIAKIVGLVLVIMLIGSINAFANEVPEQSFDITESEKGTIQPRSLYLAAAISEIANEGEGVLRIYADFTSHAGVDWGQITINLYRSKNPDSGSWSKVKTYTKTFDGADDPDGKITYAYTEFNVHGLATDYYYYLSCNHKVKTPSGYESKTTRTDAVLLTAYPVFRSLDETK